MSRTVELITEKVVDATIRMNLPEWNWSEGVALYGLTTLWKRKGSEEIIRFIDEWISRQIAKGQVFETINATAPCFSLLELEQEKSNEDYHRIIRSRVEFLMNDAKKLHNGAFEHTLVETKFGGQMWVDTLFMAGLFLVRAGILLDRQDVVEEGIKQYLIHIRELQQDNGLMYHAWDEGKQSVIGCQWARGNAWAVIVSVELLDMLHKDHPVREEIADRLERQLRGLQETQDLSGLWTTVITDPRTYLETSAAAGIAYGVMKGIRLGVVDQEFSAMGVRAMRAVHAYVDWEGVLRGVSSGTGVQSHPGEYHVIARDRMEGYGQGLLLLMLSEL